MIIQAKGTIRQMYDVIVVGGGAAGLMAAGFAAQRGLKVAVLERNARVARKLMITGKGRCNLTNLCGRDDFMSAITANPRFLYSAYSAFSPYDTVDFFEALGVPTKTERGNRVFPQSDKAVDIVDALHSFATDSGADILHGRAIALIIKDGAVCGVKCENGEKIEARAVIIATGGMSYPKTGSTGDGYALAKQAGHSIIKPTPSLVPLNIHEGFCEQLMGLSLKNVAIRVVDTVTERTIYTDMGEMLFTHFGVSGPMILSASAHMRKTPPERCKIYIDMKPALDEKTLDNRLLRDFSENINRELINSLDKLLPKKLIPVVIRLSGLQPKQKVNQITKRQRLEFINTIKSLPLTVTSFRPIDEAIITSGGVDTKQIEPKTMRSKLCNNLYFAGEVIDVDAYTGGFNLQIAFSTACIAGKNVLQ